MRPSIFILILGYLVLTSAYSSAQTAKQKDDRKDRIRELQGESRFVEIVDYLTDNMNVSDSGEIDLMNDAITWAKQNGDTLDRLTSELLLARYFIRRGEERKALTNLNKVIRSSLLTEEMLFAATIEMRAAYRKLGAYDKAMEYHRMINWESAPESHEKYAPESFLAFIYSAIGDYPRAIEILRQSIAKMNQHQFKFHEMSFTNSLGFFHERNGQLDSAMFYYEKALDLLEVNFEPGGNMEPDRYGFIHGLFMGNKGQVLAQRGQHLRAIPLLRQDIESSLRVTQNDEYRQNGIISLIKIAKSYAAIDQFAEAKASLAEAHAIMVDHDSPEIRMQWYQGKADYLHKVGDDKGAFESLYRLIQFRDSLQSHQIIVRTSNLIATYEALNQEEKWGKNMQEISDLRKRSKTQQNINILFIVVIIIAIAFSIYTTYVSRTNKKRQLAITTKNQEIQEQKRLIESSLRDKEILLREVNHRVKNNLQIIASMLYLQSRKVDDPNAKSIMNDVQQRIQTMSSIHQKLYQEDEFEQVNFQDYVQELVTSIISSYQLDNKSIKLKVAIDVEGITVDRAVPLSFIIHELASNSLKHAFQASTTGTINIQMNADKNEGKLRYWDDGKGIQKGDLESQDGNNIGMKLIRLLSTQLGATFEVIDEAPLCIEIRFPIQ